MNRSGNAKMDNKILFLPVASGEEIKEKCMIALDENGYAVMATKKEGLKIAGLSQQYMDNRLGGDGDRHVNVSRGAFVFENDGTIKETDILKECYVSAAQMVTLTSTGSSVAGIIIGVEDDGVIVDIIHSVTNKVTTGA